MIMKFIGNIFAGRSRAIIVVHFCPAGGQLCVLTHDDETLFLLDKGEEVATATRFILRQGFKYIQRNLDIHAQDYRPFEQDGIEYQIVRFDGPVVPDGGVDGYEKLRAAGFDFILIGDHPLSPRLNKIMRRN
jgi:hypothetical protein